MKWVSKVQNSHNVGDRRVKRKFLFVPRSFVRNEEKHSYWLQFAAVEEELQQFMFERGDYINEPYENWYENRWVEVGVVENESSH